MGVTDLNWLFPCKVIFSYNTYHTIVKGLKGKKKVEELSNKRQQKRLQTDIGYYLESTVIQKNKIFSGLKLPLSTLNT